MANLKKQGVPFTQVANAVLTANDISCKAKGMFAYLFSKPEGWEFSGDRIVDEMFDGRKTVYAAIKELEKKGYLKRSKKSNGRIEYLLKYGDEPVDRKGQEPVDRLGKVPKGQSAERGNISNTEEESNTDKENNTELATQSVAATQLNKDIAEVIYRFKNLINPSAGKFYKNKPQREAAGRLINLYGFEKVCRAVEYAASVQGKQYAPVITTPLQLEDKMAALSGYYKREEAKTSEDSPGVYDFTGTTPILRKDGKEIILNM